MSYAIITLQYCKEVPALKRNNNLLCLKKRKKILKF